MFYSQTNDLPRNDWPMSRVLETMVGDDGCVRKVKVVLSSQIDDKGKRVGDASVFERPIHKLIVLVKAQSCHEGP